MSNLKQIQADLAAAQRDVAEARADLAAASRVTRDTADVFGAPSYVRKVGDGQSFNMAKLVKSLMDPAYGRAHAQYELNLCAGFRDRMQAAGAKYDTHGAVVVPIDFMSIPDDVRGDKVVKELESAMMAGRLHDPSETAHWVRRVSGQTGQPVFMKSASAQSAFDQSLGGSLIAPPEFGPIIELYRNTAVLVKAGAQERPLPVQGSIKYPRQTSASRAYWEGEGETLTQTNVGTGDMTLSAKKITSLVISNNELLKYAPGSANALIQADMAKSIALGIDYAGLYGTGGSGVPLGIVNRSINKVTAAVGIATNGNTLHPEDAQKMVTKVLSQNAPFTGWVCSPILFWGQIAQFRADAVTAGDGAGVWLNDLIRRLGDKVEEKMAGFPVFTSNQVATNRIKGTGTTLSTLFGGNFGEIVIGLHGAIEIIANPWGDTTFKANQTMFRAIAYGDVNIQHEAGLVMYDDLILPAV